MNKNFNNNKFKLNNSDDSGPIITESLYDTYPKKKYEEFNFLINDSINKNNLKKTCINVIESNYDQFYKTDKTSQLTSQKKVILKKRHKKFFLM